MRRILVGIGVGAGGAVGYNAFKSPTVILGLVVVAYYVLNKK